MKKIIFRVDDRLIHGQVIEGWIKHFKIASIIVACDRIAGDPLQEMIYKSSLPQGCDLEIMTVKQMKSSFSKDDYKKKMCLVLYESVDDLYNCRYMFDSEIYLNIGCVASREHKYEISDTVFLDIDEINKACDIRKDFPVFVHKLPWEHSVEINNFSKFLEGSEWK